jgi:hypothetical protein
MNFRLTTPGLASVSVPAMPFRLRPPDHQNTAQIEVHRTSLLQLFKSLRRHTNVFEEWT